MPDNDQDGVMSQFLKKKSDERLKAQILREEADTIAHRERMLSRTSLSPYQVACLKDIPIRTIRRAWFTISHLLLEPNSMVAVMGCGDGALAYAMAVLNPDYHIIGLDSDRHQITTAKKNWQMTNLEFVVSKISNPSFPNNSLDAVVDSFTLHEVYSRQGFSDGSVREMLNHHFALLKHGGTLFLRDYIHPPPGEYVMVEFPDYESYGDEPEELSEADLLVRFSEEAKSGDGEGRGFFLEELEPYAEGTRLFRLPYKWAYEFILRKDRRDEWEAELAKEYTFMTEREIHKLLRSLEARVLYSAPNWDSYTIRNRYLGHFLLYDDDGDSIGYPPTSHVFVAKKVGEGESILLTEGRPSREPTSHLRFESVYNKATGEIMDLVSRDTEIVEFLPYRITDNGRLNIFLHEGMPRAITNAVPRRGRNIDGKRWSGHMIEAIGVDREILSEHDSVWTPESTQEFTLRHLGLRPANNAIMEQGPEFYPNPSMIDERIETKFVNVQKSKRSLTPRWVSEITKSFSDTGKIKEFDAQHVLNAISIGLIPSARLERQILALFAMLGIAADNWADSPIQLEELDIVGTSYQELANILRDDGKHFTKSAGSAGSIRSLHAYFVDEGVENGVIKGLSAHDEEFIIEENKTVNTAVVIPLVKSLSGEVMAGYIKDYLPVPERMGRNSKTIRAPSFNLPPEVNDMNSAKIFIAQQFGVGNHCVVELGESYFIHNGLTPQRIFPFAITTDIRGSKGPVGTFTEYAPVRFLWILVWHLFDESIAFTLKKALERMHLNIDFGMNKGVGMNTGQEHARWMTPPPYGMPIPNSPEEHDMMVAEYRGSQAHITPDSYEQAPPKNTARPTQRSLNSNVRPISSSTTSSQGDTSGDSSSSSAEGSGSGSSSSSSGGGMEKGGAEGQENRNNNQQKRTAPSGRRFQNIDYSSIDGDKPKQEKEASQKKNQVISILRPPPTRKSSTANTFAEPALAAVDMDTEDYDLPDPRNNPLGDSGADEDIPPPTFEN